MSAIKVLKTMENPRSERNFPSWVRNKLNFKVNIDLLRYFSSIEDIRTTIEFPPKSAFYSKLKQTEVSDDEYNDSKRLYESRLSLPDDHPEKWRNFADFLKFYNMLDVRPLVQALSICFRKFKEFFHVDPGTYQLSTILVPINDHFRYKAQFTRHCI